MNQGRPVFSQLLDQIHPQQFDRLVRRHVTQATRLDFTCWEQFLCMAFAQLTYRSSLRDTVDCLMARRDVLYHLGFRSPIRRSTLADANERRDWHLYAALAESLIRKARRLYQGDALEIDLDATAYVLDSTTIDLCLNLFPWARFRRTKAAIKLHTLLDLRGPIPAFASISEGRQHDVNALDEILVEPGAFYVMDRAYLDFSRLHTLHRSGAFFVIRAKLNLQAIRLRSQPVDMTAGVQSDQLFRLRGYKSRKGYPDVLRRVRFFDEETHRYFVYLTNHMDLPALVVAQLYKARWTVEIFFKWIKQHLRIQRFYGESPNAVKTQVWIAVCVYVLVAIIRKELGLSESLHKILQVLSVNAFEKVPMDQLLTNTLDQSQQTDSPNQLMLFTL
jgi:hypothetical protein